jgi:hypothetical protein
MKSHYLDYGVSPECENPDSYGEICVKCNRCGRKAERKEREHVQKETWESNEQPDPRLA